MIEPVKDRFTVEIIYRKYCLIEKSFLFHDDIALEFHKMAKKITVQKKDRTISEEDAMLVTELLQQFNSAYDACQNLQMRDNVSI